MDCRIFDRRLDDLLDGRCGPESWADAVRHAEACTRCGRLLAAVTGELDDRGDGDRAALTDSVLARTTGAACAGADLRLPDFVDGALAPDDRELVAGHLAGCASCRALVAALDEAAALLPAFADLATGAGFAERVLARTVRQVPEPSAAGRIADRIAAWWSRAAARPRFAIEVAYVATLVLVVTVGNPVAAFRDTSSRVAAVAGPRIETAVTVVLDPVASAGASGLERVRSAVRSVAGREGRPAAASGAAGVWWLGRWIDAVFGGSLRPLIGHVWNAAVSLRQAWTRLWTWEPAVGRPETGRESPGEGRRKPDGTRRPPTEPGRGGAR